MNEWPGDHSKLGFLYYRCTIITDPMPFYLWTHGVSTKGMQSWNY